MVTNGHVIHKTGRATQALGVCVCANQGLKHGSFLDGMFRKGGGMGGDGRERDTGGKGLPWPKPKYSKGSLEPGGRCTIYNLQSARLGFSRGHLKGNGSPTPPPCHL